MAKKIISKCYDNTNGYIYLTFMDKGVKKLSIYRKIRNCWKLISTDNA